MKAFTDTTMTKPEMLSALLWHQKQDNFVRGRYFENGKGCAVGCSLESVARMKGLALDYSDHKEFEKHLGVPEWLARVEDVIFERVSIDRSKTWPLEFIEAVNEGSDLNQIKAPFMIFVLKSNLDNFDHAKSPDVVKAINTCIDLWEKYPEGPSAAWSAAESAAWSAAESAESAAAQSAESAARSAARSAESAESAARSAARSAAESAAWSAAESAAWSAAESAESAAAVSSMVSSMVSSRASSIREVCRRASEAHARVQMSNQQIDDSSIPLQETEAFPIRDHVRLQNYLKDAKERIKELEHTQSKLRKVIERYDVQVGKLQASNDMLKEALEFYADIKSWSESHHCTYREIREDTENLVQSYSERPDILHPVGGKRAREALSKLKSHSSTMETKGDA
jgi:hypothetical protein